MHATKIVACKMETIRGPEAFLAKAIRQTRKPSHLHSDGEVQRTFRHYPAT